MRKFAKIFEVDNRQILFTKRVRDDEYCIRHEAEIDNNMIMSFTVDYSSELVRDSLFDSTDQKRAEDIFRAMLESLEG